MIFQPVSILKNDFYFSTKACTAVEIIECKSEGSVIALKVL